MILSILLFVFLSCGSINEEAKIKATFAEFLEIHLEMQEVFKKYYKERETITGIPEYEKVSKKDSDFMENQLIPIFPLVQEQICDHKNDEIFDGLMEIMIRTSGSAEEELSNILGKIYACRPDFMLAYITKHTEYSFLIRSVDFGFSNVKHQNLDSSDFSTLKAKLDSLNTVRPFRN